MKRLFLILFILLPLYTFGQLFPTDYGYAGIDSIQFANDVNNNQTYGYDSTKHPMLRDSITQWVTVNQLNDTADNLRTNLLRKDAVRDSINQFKIDSSLATLSDLSDSNLWIINGDTIKTKLTYKVKTNDTLFLETDSSIYEVIEARGGGGSGSGLPRLNPKHKGIPFLNATVDTFYFDSIAFNFNINEDSLFVVQANIDTIYFFRIIPQGSGGSVFIGENAGLNDDGTSNFNWFSGTNAGQETTTGFRNFAAGYRAFEKNVNGFSNSAISAFSLFSSVNGTNNVCIGPESGFSQVSASNCIKIGYQTGYSGTSSNNVYIGTESFRNNVSGSGNISIGYLSGQNETGSNRLYVENSNSGTPLIGGKFDVDQIGINKTISDTWYNTFNVGGDIMADFANSSTTISGAQGIGIYNTNATPNNLKIIRFGQNPADKGISSYIVSVSTDRTGSSEDEEIQIGGLDDGTQKVMVELDADSVDINIDGISEFAVRKDSVIVKDTLIIGSTTSKLYDSDGLNIQSDSLKPSDHVKINSNKDLLFGDNISHNYNSGDYIIDAGAGDELYIDFDSIYLRNNEGEGSPLTIKDNNTITIGYNLLGADDSINFNSHVVIDSNLYVGGSQVRPLSVGGNNQIPHMNTGGTDFDYDGGFLYDNGYLDVSTGYRLNGNEVIEEDTDTLEINAQGIYEDVRVTGNFVQKQHIGQLYVDGDSVFNIAATGIYYTWNMFEIDTALNTTCTDSSITVLKEGWYMISNSASFTHVTNNTVVHHSIFVNDIERTIIECERKISTGGDVGSTSNQGLIYLSVNDVVKVKFKTDKTGNLTVGHFNFHIIRM